LRRVSQGNEIEGRRAGSTAVEAEGRIEEEPQEQKA
jgi:hypothetical protein